MRKNFLEAVEDNPVIAAVKDEEGLNRSFESDCNIIFILFGDICTIPDIVRRAKEHGKITLVHMDLISGLGTRDVSVDYIKQNTSADGIISTKQSFVKRAKELGLFTVLRFFVIDSLAYENILVQTKNAHPDLIEILPGVMPKVISKIVKTAQVPVIAGGLISDREDVMTALNAGAVSVSTTRPDLWFI